LHIFLNCDNVIATASVGQTIPSEIHMHINHKGLLIAALASVIAPSASAQYWNLGFLNFASSASGDGSVVAGYHGETFFKWTASGGLEDIGGYFSAGTATISTDGSKIGGSAINTSTGNSEMALYNMGSETWTTLGGIGGSSDGSTSSGWSLSGDGSTSVGLGWVDAGTAHAIKYQAGTTTDMGSTVTDRSSRANGVNNDGSTIVGWQDSEDGFRQGAVWKNGVQTLLFDNASNQLGEASDVSANGEWVVGEGVWGNGGEAWRWSESTGYLSLGAPLSFGDSAAAVGISDDGNTIVGFSRGFGPATWGQGFIWTADGGMTNLTSYVTGLGIDLQGTTLALPLGISADGRTIVGLDSTANGFVVQLPAPVPEPASMAALGIGALGMLARRRRSKSTK